MKLVELLAKELAEWPEYASCITQDDGGCMNGGTVKYPPVLHGTAWGEGAFYLDDPDNTDSVMRLTQADDYLTAIVTRAQWQAERDRRKGGEWKRHRAGRNQPVAGDVLVEVKLRDGDIQQAKASAFLWNHSDCDVYANIMQYRIISQPKAEEVDTREYRGPFPCAPIGEPENAIEFDIEFPSGAIHLEAQVDQIDGPIRWRDTVNELDAYIEEFTRERESLINRLALEGFALIPAMTPVMGVADIVFPIEEWQIGDIVEVTSVSCESAAPLGVFTITDIDSSEPKYELDDQYFPNHNQMKFIRRP
jgi:hypothetical protein